MVARAHETPEHARGEALANALFERTRQQTGSACADAFMLPASSWRQSTVARRSMWLCTGCECAWEHSVVTCPSCGEASALAIRDSQAQMHAALRGATDSAYGRSLRFISGREQHAGEVASLGMFGSADYGDLVDNAVDDVLPDMCARERRDYVPSEVLSFDAYLQIVTCSRVHFVTKEEVQDAVGSGHASKLLQEYVTLMACKTNACAADGGVAMVQRLPKGGYWKFAIAKLTEHHLRIVRAVLGASKEMPIEVLSCARATGNYIRDSCLHDGSWTFKCLHALAAAVFVQAAHDELAVGGRLYNPKAPAQQKEEWFRNGVCVPRKVVAEVARFATSKATGRRLHRAMEARVAMRS